MSGTYMKKYFVVLFVLINSEIFIFAQQVYNSENELTKGVIQMGNASVAATAFF
jgi:hypothetical protein